ncbi:hydrogenase expression/formation protein HypE [Candidatus Methylospira mobilis]|uniref:Hydrogenase expression/formation protein HypE n=1 Tax=Candidatus Methylospira mobilis TaxID=1808979 RepID=A0A5Q0BEZ8_9GAMM|nr:hydrogenase expression/formation protein HypE [Candidatus Methylospira mobilis]QFY41702.1 hydrogenase expression/formation protein HypE [Candidatus Methylospira mobilis]
MTTEQAFNLNCPLPIGQYEHATLAHGGGGRLMQQLLERLIRPAFDNRWLDQRHDSTVLDIGGSRLAFTTDGYVVKPLFFPGGDIGKLAVCGTLNDLAMSGAKPLFLSASLIIEEGFPFADLQRILHSMGETARAAGVAIVTGDTKVVENGKGDGLYIVTSGIGSIEHRMTIGPSSIAAGDDILVTGDIGRHGVAIISEREGLRFETSIASDCADLSGLVAELLAAGCELHCLRDLTRGGLASAVLELARDAQLSIELDEAAIPVLPQVSAACEMLGFDPLYVANEGQMTLFVPPPETERVLALLHQHSLGRRAAKIGSVTSHGEARVELRNAFGIKRVLDLLSGEQLPRIC